MKEAGESGKGGASVSRVMQLVLAKQQGAPGAATCPYRYLHKIQGECDIETRFWFFELVSLQTEEDGEAWTMDFCGGCFV